MACARSTSRRPRESRLHAVWLEDYTHWQTADRTMIKRINRLIDDGRREPFSGIGKLEQLRHALAGAWSRRITDEHRLVYHAKGNDLVILQARFHYE